MNKIVLGISQCGHVCSWVDEPKGNIYLWEHIQCCRCGGIPNHRWTCVCSTAKRG